MRLSTHMILSARQFVLAWTILWVTTVPLFHTHLPDSAERQTSRSGIAHTVFSPDLPGEFFRFATAHQSPFAQLSKRVSNSPELGFVFSSSGDSADQEVELPDVIGVLCSFPQRLFLLALVLESPAVHRKPLVFVTSPAPRAPPSVVSS
jgi:hypothetical protein